METKKLILVDNQNNFKGTGEKLEVHRKGELHKAFSLFIYNLNTHKILLQKRALGKYHSGGLWTNTCCSHPYLNENEVDMLKRDLIDELDVDKSFKFIDQEEVSLNENIDDLNNTVVRLDKFKYYSDYGEIKEHEIDTVYIYFLKETQGITDHFNPEEISELRWESISRIEQELKEDSNQFTTWFPRAFEIVRKFLSKLKI